MSLLKTYLLYEENKEDYSQEEREQIKKGLLKSCDEKLKQIGNVFVGAIDKINE